MLSSGSLRPGERQQELARRSLENRRARAAVRERVREPRNARVSRWLLAGELEAGPAWLDRCTVTQVLGWSYKLSPVRRQRILDAADIQSPARMWGQMTVRQRTLLVKALRDD